MTRTKTRILSLALALVASLSFAQIVESLVVRYLALQEGEHITFASAILDMKNGSQGIEEIATAPVDLFIQRQASDSDEALGAEAIREAISADVNQKISDTLEFYNLASIRLLELVEDGDLTGSTLSSSFNGGTEPFFSTDADLVQYLLERCQEISALLTETNATNLTPENWDRIIELRAELFSVYGQIGSLG